MKESMIIVHAFVFVVMIMTKEWITAMWVFSSLVWCIQALSRQTTKSKEET